MRVDLKNKHDAGIMLLEMAEVYKQYRPELTDKMALKLAILGNPDIGELYTGCPVRRDGLAEVKRFLLGGPFPQ